MSVSPSMRRREKRARAKPKEVKMRAGHAHAVKQTERQRRHDSMQDIGDTFGALFKDKTNEAKRRRIHDKGVEEARRNDRGLRTGRERVQAAGKAATAQARKEGVMRKKRRSEK